MQKRISVPDAPPSTWDFRNTTTFTIDPFDAKDFDDALSFKDLGDGTYEVGIHIADVSHYVKEGGEIDKEAIKRGTSVYLVDRTIPMLPEVLSNDLCSLNPNEDKLAFSAIFILNDKCEVQKRWFGETIINSNKRFSYIEAQKVLDDGKGEFHTELRKLEDLALLKRKRRTKNGALTFGSTEVKFKLDEKGFPIEVYEKKMLDTNYLIEDFMLLANREVTEYVERLNKKSGHKNIFVYRIHDKPKVDNIIELSKYLKKIGYDLGTDDGSITSQQINDLLNKIEGSDEETLIEKAVLKSMAKAIYSTNNIGHFGLAFAFYTHFTSPIRRYPDLMVHRLMKKYLKGENVSNEEIGKYNQLCASSSHQEILAMEAERDSVKYKYVEYMSKRIGEEFEGIITSVMSWGVYIQDTKTKAEGLVRVSTLKGDYYSIDPQNYRIVGEKTGKKFTLGDKVKVKLIGTDLDRKTIDFEIIN
jgi:ribonuclease R